MELSGKVAIVTGVSKGIGYELVKGLLAKGAKVAGWSRHSPDIQDDRFEFITTDMASEAEVAAAFEKTQQAFGNCIDVLINNAGYGQFKLMEDFTTEEWKKMFDVNVHGIFHASKLVLPGMKNNGGGHIINLSSIAGKQGTPQGTAYCGSKHAVRGISEALYREAKPDNIKVTCIFPGSVNTDFFDDVEGTTANPTMLHADDVADIIIQQLETPDNFNTSELEIRPMNVSYKG